MDAVLVLVGQFLCALLTSVKRRVAAKAEAETGEKRGKQKHGASESNCELHG